MLTHQQIWGAIDALAERHQLSPSALAKKAGMDPTSFNKSKRVASGGKLRWPSTESLARILHVTGESLNDFVRLVEDTSLEGENTQKPIPITGFADAPDITQLDDPGLLTEPSWKLIPRPDMQMANSFALEVSSSVFEPLYRAGDTLLLSIEAKISRANRVIVKTRSGEMFASVFERQTTKGYKLRALDDAATATLLPHEEIDWIARIIWASQ